MGTLETLTALGHLHQDQIGPRLEQFTRKLRERGIQPDGEVEQISIGAASHAEGRPRPDPATRRNPQGHPVELHLTHVLAVNEPIITTDEEKLTVTWIELWSDQVTVGWADNRHAVDDQLDALLDPNRSLEDRREAARERARALRLDVPLNGWSLMDDLGTVYDSTGGGASGRHPSRGSAGFRPAVPTEASHLIVTYAANEADSARILIDLP